MSHGRQTAMLSALQQACEKLQQLLLQDRTQRGEAKAWLINTIAQLQHISRAARWACFHPCDTYPSSSDRDSYGRLPQHHAQPRPVATCKDAELHLLQLLTELAPADVSTLLLRDPDWVCDFLTASRDRIRAWFGGFGPTSIQHFRYGARALANYALSERAAAWQHLVWSGKHSQSPVAVAAKPHYFGELDVVATVRNLARSCPGFWSSDELMRSCQAGDWLGLDREAVAKELLRLLHDQRSSRQRPLQQLLSDFLASTDWGPLCHRLLPLLPDKGLLQVAHTLANDVYASKQKQQRQQGRTNVGCLLSCWCSEQVSSCRQLAEAAGGQGQGQELKGPAELQAIAVPAAQLSCVSEFHMLLLGVLQLVNQGQDSWTLDQLLLADALTCYRGQLLALLRQDEDAISHLRTLVAAAAAVWPAESTTAPPAGATAAAAAERGAAPAGNGTAKWWQQLLAAVHEQAAPQRLLLVLAAGWLLRLQVMLQLAGDVKAPAGAQQEQQHHHWLRHAAVRLPTGDMCYLLTSSAAVSRSADAEVLHDAAPMQLEAAQQQQETQQEQQQGNQQHKVQHQQCAHQQQQQAAADPQQGPPAKTPLRRGSVAAFNANADNDSSSSEGDNHSRKDRRRHSSSHKHSSKKSKHKHSSHKHHRKRSRRHSSSGSDVNSSGSGSDGGNSSGRRKRRKRRCQSGRSRHSSSDAASSDGEDEWAGMDLDGGGELLDATDFQLKPQSTAQRTSASKQQQQQQPAGASDVSKGEAAQQGQEEPVTNTLNGAGVDVDVVHDRMASLAVGGRMWQWPQCVVDVLLVDKSNSEDRSARARAGGATASGASAETGTQAQHVFITGSIVEVADAVAQLWLCRTLQQAALA